MISLGIELEMAVINDRSGRLHLVREYFRNLRDIRRERGEQADLEFSGAREIGVVSRQVISSLDNGYNNLESGIGPITGSRKKLMQLSIRIDQELHDVMDALAPEGATLINFSEHPAQLLGERYYRLARSPRPIYDYWVDYRGWNHKAGIDAKAHNGPTTGISWDQAVAGLNLLLGFSPVFIALFANSPFAQGKMAGCKENRQNLWPQMFASSRFACDRKLHRIPERPFSDLRDYLQWMFGQGTRMQALPVCGGSTYKETAGLARVRNDPSLLSFLAGPAREAIFLPDNTRIAVMPSMRHLEFLQFSQFLDCRIRFAMGKEDMALDHFVEAMQGNGPLEELFAGICSSVYLEGRASGANFPDNEILGWGDVDCARSVVISPAALQVALLRNLPQSRSLLNRYCWSDLLGLRQQAIQHGLQGEYGSLTVLGLCRDVLELAAAELHGDELWMLAYPMRVLKSQMNGADRALFRFERIPGHPDERLQRLIMERRVSFPPAC